MDRSDLARRSYDREVRQHRENLARALDETRRVLNSLGNRLHAGNADMTLDSRRLLAAATDAVQAAGALSAADQLSFGFEEES